MCYCFAQVLRAGSLRKPPKCLHPMALNAEKGTKIGELTKKIAAMTIECLKTHYQDAVPIPRIVAILSSYERPDAPIHLTSNPGGL